MKDNLGKLVLLALLIGTSLYWGADSFTNDSVNLKNTDNAELDVTDPSNKRAAPSDEEQTKSNLPQLSDNIPTSEARDVVLDSLDDLITLFDSLDYNTQSWLKGNREVPRLTFEGVSDNWHKTSNEIPVQQKKMVFFRLMAPLILVSNEKILLERQIVEAAKLNDPELKRIALRYKAITDASVQITQDIRLQLLNQVDILPPSLVLAQAAEESGWATSRFTLEGNAFFGQWDFSGKGMIPKQQRKELGNYGLARFDSPLASVEGYMFNLNTNNAYVKLRNLRTELRKSGHPITGPELAGTLDKYSERGQAYIDGIREMIRFNKLDQVDQAYLSSKPPLHLISNKQE
ncbi:putative FlgJ-like protein [Shewanella psychrophila]|uniref:Putative FlgJ-like protein n=1 Tax=Shewanella psychrophila TaxID=225848 RepID=A0A1S6HQI7_9GAMM|nr:glucosaminidase domain-containing protein [Shewanella psychrophila]AQS37795.1 putative FlgJ-like protein [Shewanella psychrophila]